MTFIHPTNSKQPNKQYKLVFILTTIFTILFHPTISAQTCKSSTISNSNDTQQFVIDTSTGTVINALTGLEWSICSLGQSYENGNCVGLPTHFDSYSAALTEVTAINAGNDQWKNFRLPNIKELGSIIERSCNEPAISLTAFTGTLNAIYYSSTPDNLGNQHFSPLLGVKVIDFTNGTEFVPDVNKYRYVRLVRSIN